MKAFIQFLFGAILYCVLMGAGVHAENKRHLELIETFNTLK